jgi:hypothetical protein
MNPYPLDMREGFGLTDAMPLPPAITSLFASVKHRGRFTVPPELHLRAFCGELKLDLREALFPEKHTLVVADCMCASVTVLLPEGATVVDRSSSLASSHQVTMESDEFGPVIHLEGWNVFSDVKFLADK